MFLIKNSLREFSTMFATADTNRNGRIDFDEWVQTLLNTAKDNSCFRFVEMMLPPNANPMDAPTWLSPRPLLTRERSRNCLLSSLEPMFYLCSRPVFSEQTPGCNNMQACISKWNCISRWQHLTKTSSSASLLLSKHFCCPPPPSLPPLFVALNTNKHLNQPTSSAEVNFWYQCRQRVY